MELKEAREKFVEAWGTFGSAWGINRSMAQVHALLLISTDPLSTEDVMEQLNISRGNANMNLRALIDWNLVRRVLKSGERREFFEAEKDVWKVATHITRERKKRELEPRGLHARWLRWPRWSPRCCRLWPLPWWRSRTRSPHLLRCCCFRHPP